MRRRKLLWAIFLVAIGAYFIYGYIYKDHRDIQAEAPTMELTGEELLQKFQNGEGNDLLNKTISVSGEVTLLEESAVTIANSVYASFITLPSEIKAGESYVIKGRCIGYDDLFEVVKIDQCSLSK